MNDYLGQFSAARMQMLEQLGKVVIGQAEVIEQILAAVFTRGHCLLVGVPGLAKTLMDDFENLCIQKYNAYFVDLFVRTSNKVAQGMYEKFGYSTCEYSNILTNCKKTVGVLVL